MRIASHRGIGFGAENTLTAAMATRRAGITHLEVDVHMTADGHLLLCHDAVQTSNDGKRLHVPLVTRNELYDAGIMLPALRSLVDLVGDDLVLMVELKRGTLSETYSADMAFALEQAELPEATEIISFHLGTLHRLRQAGCENNLIWNVRDPSTAPSLDLKDSSWLYAVSSHICWATVGECQRIRSHGMKCGAYGVDDEQEALKAAEIGCDFVISDRPAELRSLATALSPGHGP